MGIPPRSLEHQTPTRSGRKRTNNPRAKNDARRIRLSPTLEAEQIDQQHSTCHSGHRLTNPGSCPFPTAAYCSRHVSMSTSARDGNLLAHTFIRCPCRLLFWRRVVGAWSKASASDISHRFPTPPVSEQCFIPSITRVSVFSIHGCLADLVEVRSLQPAVECCDSTKTAEAVVQQAVWRKQQPAAKQPPAVVGCWMEHQRYLRLPFRVLQ